MHQTVNAHLCTSILVKGKDLFLFTLTNLRLFPRVRSAYYFFFSEIRTLERAILGLELVRIDSNEPVTFFFPVLERPDK